MAKKGNGAISVMADKDWQAECDCDALIRAEEIKKDPKRFAAAKEVAKERLQGIVNVAGEKE